MKIYVITQGKYSEYHIVAATTDKTKAKNLQKIFDSRGDDFYSSHIEEYEDGAYKSVNDKGYLIYYVRLIKDKNEGRNDVIVEQQNKAWKEINKVENNHNPYIKIDYNVLVEASDPDHAKKIGLDLISEYRYNEEVENIK